MTTEDDEREARSRRSWELRGFVPDAPRHEFFGCFTFEEAQHSLFQSTRTNPVPVYLTDDRDEDIRIPVVLDLARPLYSSELIPRDDEAPDWYFEGWEVPSGWQDVSIRRIRIHVAAMKPHEFDSNDIFTWQEIIPVDTKMPSTTPLDLINYGLTRGSWTRMKTLLASQNITTIGDVLAANAVELSRREGVGPVMVWDLKQALSAAGYEYSPVIPKS